MSSTLIINAQLVNEGKIKQQDILIKNGRIHKIGANLQSEISDAQVDAKGLYLIPGMIDDQVHFREPGLVHKGDFETESTAAVAGGITSYMEMPNSDPQTITIEALADKYNRAKGRSRANFAFYLGATSENLKEIVQVGNHPAAGLKIFMGASTGNMLVDNEEILMQIFKECPRLIVTHCEDTPIILVNEAKYQRTYGDDIPFELHPVIRSREACIKSSELAKRLAAETDARLHILHLTTAEEANSLSAASDALESIEKKRITAEVCVHHLYFSEQRYGDLGGLIKCNPAIKTLEDRKALRQAVIDNRIDCIATDHAPHTLLEKQSFYTQAPSGLPLVQHALPALLELVHDKVFELPMLVTKTSHAVASLYKIPDRGYIREGYWADLVLIDMDKKDVVANQDIFYKCRWTPFKNETFRSRVTHTWVNGALAYTHIGSKRAKIIGKPMGQPLDIQVKRHE